MVSEAPTCISGTRAKTCMPGGEVKNGGSFGVIKKNPGLKNDETRKATSNLKKMVVIVGLPGTSTELNDGFIKVLVTRWVRVEYQ